MQKNTLVLNLCLDSQSEKTIKTIKFQLSTSIIITPECLVCECFRILNGTKPNGKEIHSNTTAGQFVSSKNAFSVYV